MCRRPSERTTGARAILQDARVHQGDSPCTETRIVRDDQENQHHIDEELHVDFAFRRLSSSPKKRIRHNRNSPRHWPHAKTFRARFEESRRDLPTRHTCILRVNLFPPIMIALFALARVAAEPGHDQRRANHVHDRVDRGLTLPAETQVKACTAISLDR